MLKDLLLHEFHENLCSLARDFVYVCRKIIQKLSNTIFFVEMCIGGHFTEQIIPKLTKICFEVFCGKEVRVIIIIIMCMNFDMKGCYFCFEGVIVTHSFGVF